MKRIFFILLLSLTAADFHCADKSKITVSAIGDIMAHANVQRYALSTEKEYSKLFEDTEKIFLRDDLTIANLETNVNDDLPIRGYPRFNAKTKFIDAIKKSGIEVLSIANNHSIDQGEQGIKSTINALKNRSVVFSGNGLNLPEARTPAIINVNNIKIGFFSITASVNDPPPEEAKKKFYVNFAPPENPAIFSSFCDIIGKTKKSVDIMIVSYHSGDEYGSKPTPLQQRAFLRIAEAGADVVLGHHPHVLYKVEYYTTKDNRRALIAYSLGNFISAQNEEIPELNINNSVYDSEKTKTAEGMILLFDIDKNEEAYSVINPRIIPTFNMRFVYNTRNIFYGFRLMPMNDILKMDDKNTFFGKNLPDIKKIVRYRMEVIKKTVGLPVVSY